MSEVKFCKHCNVEHPLTAEFWRFDKRTNKFSECKQNIKQRGKNYYQNNKAVLIDKVKKYYEQNGDARRIGQKKYYSENRQKIIAKGKEYHAKNRTQISIRVKSYYQNNKNLFRDYAENNKDRIKKTRQKNAKQKNLTQKFKRKTDIQFKLRCNLRTRLCNALKAFNIQKRVSSVEDLGCSLEDFKKHIESKFLPGMSWSNWSRNGFHIDHIRPLASFDLTDPEQQKQACSWTNLQPLWAKDNLSKGAKYEEIHAATETSV